MIDEELLPLRFACLEKIVEHPADIGKTKIQKITYFLQEAVGVPLKYPFRMHYYGPYSYALDDVLSLAKAFGYVNIKPDPDGFGYRVTPSEMKSIKLYKECDISKYANAESIDKAISALGKLDTPDLELYATIHFVGLVKSELSKEETVELVHRLKPKFSVSYVRDSYERLSVDRLI